MLVASSIGLAQEQEEVVGAVQASPVRGQHLQQSSERWRNITAVDLQPSWNHPTVMVKSASLSLLTTEQAKERMSTFERLRAPHASTDGPKVALHTVPADSMTVVGERGGITYAAWKGGPAGTMPIRHYYESHDTDATVSADFAAVLRRSSKIWSKRLVDDGLRHDITLLDGKIATDVSGIVLQTRLNNYHANGASVLGYNSDKNGGGYRSYNGRIRISLSVHDNVHDGTARVLAHEIGHVLGVAVGGTQTFKDTYYDAESHTWSGPNSLRENDGDPVNLQWVGTNQWWRVMEPHAPGAVRDISHLGDCTALMAYCSNPSVSPSELDFAFLADIGYTLVDADVAAETERYGRASWGQWAVWGASIERDLQDNFQGNPKKPHDFVRAHADVFGIDPDMPLSRNSALTHMVGWRDGLESNTSGNLIGTGNLTGQVSWEGSLHGIDMRDGRLFPVIGKAALRVDLFTLVGTVRFSDIKVYVDSNKLFSEGRSEAFRKSALSYAIKVTDNSFTDGKKKIHGRFFGPSHQEMAGTINDTSSSVELLGGFGGIRATP